MKAGMNHVEKYYGKSIERIQNECIGPSAYNHRYAAALDALLTRLGQTPSVIELPPSGLIYKSWRVVKQANGLIVTLTDRPENIVKRLIFTDVDSKPIEVTLTARQKDRYLIDIRKDITYYKTGHSRAHFQVDLDGLTPAEAADKVISISQFMPLH